MLFGLCLGNGDSSKLLTSPTKIEQNSGVNISKENTLGVSSFKIDLSPSGPFLKRPKKMEQKILSNLHCNQIVEVAMENNY